MAIRKSKKAHYCLQNNLILFQSSMQVYDSELALSQGNSSHLWKLILDN